MSTTIMDFGRRHQTGRTTMMIGALMQLHSMNLRVAYVAPSADMATDVARKFKLPCHFYYSGIQYERFFDKRYRAIAIDDIDYIAPGLYVPFRNRVLDRLAIEQGPTQLLIAR